MNRGVSVTVVTGRPQPRDARPARHARPVVSETRVRNSAGRPGLSRVSETIRGIRIGYARVSTREQNTDGQPDAQQRPGANASTWTRPRARWPAARSGIAAASSFAATTPWSSPSWTGWAAPCGTSSTWSASSTGQGVELVVLAQGIDTTSPGGRLLFHVLAAMAEFVGDLISENAHESLAAARVRGRVGGRPTVMTAGKLRVARQMLDGGQHGHRDRSPQHGDLVAQHEQLDVLERLCGQTGSANRGAGRRSGRAGRSDPTMIVPGRGVTPIATGHDAGRLLEPHSAPRGAWNRVEV